MNEDVTMKLNQMIGLLARLIDATYETSGTTTVTASPAIVATNDTVRSDRVEITNEPIDTIVTNTPLPVQFNSSQSVSISNQPIQVIVSHPSPDIRYTSFEFTGNTETTIVPAVSGKKIRVISLAVCLANIAGTVRWKSGTAGSWLSGTMSFPASGGYALSSLSGLFETAVGEALVLSHTVSGGGHLSYVLVD